MKSFTEISVGSSSFKTHEIEDESPQWNETFTFNASPTSAIELTLYKDAEATHKGILHINSLSEHMQDLVVVLDRISPKPSKSLLSFGKSVDKIEMFIRAIFLSSNSANVVYPSRDISNLIKYPNITPLPIQIPISPIVAQPMGDIRAMPPAPIFNISEHQFERMFKKPLGSDPSVLTPDVQLHFLTFHRNYIRINDEHKVVLDSNPSDIAIKEFEGNISLFYSKTRKFISVKEDNSLKCDADSSGKSEQFSVVSQLPDGDIALVSLLTNQMIVFWPDGHITANGPGKKPSPWNRIHLNKI